MTFTLTCTGIGGTSAPQSVQVAVNAPPAGHAIVSGTILFERIPFDSVLGGGLDSDNPVPSPVRGVVVEALPSPTGTPIATTSTNSRGQYAFVLPHNTTVTVLAKAQLLATGAGPKWDFRVLNNTSGGLWALDRSIDIGTTDLPNIDLTAGTGWDGSGYTGTRAAAPFAVLDTVYEAMQLVRSASATVSFPPLNLYWSPVNRPAEPLCPSNGNIGTTFYTSGGDIAGACETIPAGIYVLGNFDAGDTDEFDRHVIAHELGHYLETEFSRSDSIGGQHSDGDKLDLRVAFGEGWGNAFAGMVVNDPVYRDSFSKMSNDFSIDVEANDSRSDEGWFSEASVGEIIWDLFDPANETNDEIELGFGPIFAALTDGQRTTTALTSIFSFLDALRDEVPAQASAINRLRNGERISGTDEFGAGESNNGGDASTLPVFRPIALNGGQQSVCVRTPNGPAIMNKLGYSKFFRLDLERNALLTIRVIAAVDPGTSGSVPAGDPDFYVYRQGEVVLFGEGTGSSETSPQTQLTAATYIIEVLDYELIGGDPPHCMTISVTGT